MTKLKPDILDDFSFIFFVPNRVLDGPEIDAN